MSPQLKRGLQFASALGLGIVLVWWVFRNEDPAVIIAQLSEAKWSWVLLTVLAAFMAHYARAARWALLLQGSGYKTRTPIFFYSVMTGYLVNLALPRVGEVSRCATVSSKENIPLPAVLGSVVAERLVDLVCLVLAIGIALVVEYEKLWGFAAGLLGDKLSGAAIWFLLLGMLLLMAASSYALWFFLWAPNAQLSPWRAKVRAMLLGLSKGLKGILHLPSPGLFIFHTVLIWVGYFLMAWLVFKALPFTADLGLGAGLAVLAMGGLAIVAPVPGGMGAYHWIITQTLLFYGLSDKDGLTYATLSHAIQFLFNLGIGALGYLLLTLSKTNEANSPENTNA